MNEREKEGCSAGTMEMLSGGEGHLSLSLFLSSFLFGGSLVVSSFYIWFCVCFVTFSSIT